MTVVNTNMSLCRLVYESGYWHNTRRYVNVTTLQEGMKAA